MDRRTREETRANLGTTCKAVKGSCIPLKKTIGTKTRNSSSENKDSRVQCCCAKDRADWRAKRVCVSPTQPTFEDDEAREIRRLCVDDFV